MSTVTVDTLLVERPTVYGNTSGYYNVAEIIMSNIVTDAGGGAGAAVTMTLDFPLGNLPTDLNYCVEVTPSQACAVSYNNKATDSVDIILTPLATGTTLVAGTMDVKISWPRG